jgi:uncharacterized membrane protein
MCLKQIKTGGFYMYRKIVGFVCVALLFLSLIACGEKEAVPLKVFKQQITSSAQLQSLNVGEKATIKVTVKNTGNEPWPNKGSDAKQSNRVGLGILWLEGSEKIIQEGRTMLPATLMPGSSVTLSVNIQAPSQAGYYKLRLSMVQEHVAWFNNNGARPFEINIQVK